MRIDGSVSIAQVAAEVPGAMSIFESLGIDYACAGQRSLEDSAHAEGIDPAFVIATIRRLASGGSLESWSDRPLSELVHYLVTQHHHFVKEELVATALRLADAGAALHPLRAAFARLSEIVVPHMHREEEYLFRVVEAMEKAWQSNEPGFAGGSLAAQIGELTLEHGEIDAHLRTLRELRMTLAASNDLPARSGTILATLATLEGRLHQYMFLENCVLFPRALALEGQTAALAASRT